MYDSPRTPSEDEGISTLEHHRLDPGRLFPREAILKGRRVSLRVGKKERNRGVGGGETKAVLFGRGGGRWVERGSVVELCSIYAAWAE